MVRNRITGLVVFGVVGLLVMTLSVTCRTGDSTTSKPEAAADITKDAGEPAYGALKEPQAVADH
jgi:hypothetical protein